jgi:CheY-like chemotaxis protein
MLTRVTSSGAEAMHLLRQGEQFDLAILDMQMPELDGCSLAIEIHKLDAYKKLPLVMLTSLGLYSLKQSDLQQHFAAYITKPIKQSLLFNTLSSVLSSQKVQVKKKQTETTRTDHQLAEKQPLRILLTEDNSTNQKVALHLLERMGYRADIAGNGLEALDSLRRQPYDVILMDVHMPEMDGLTATRLICQEWDVEARPRIIAMTANAMRGDREKCIEAGMDDYISKPIRIEELIKALKHCKPISLEPYYAQSIVLESQNAESALKTLIQGKETTLSSSSQELERQVLEGIDEQVLQQNLEALGIENSPFLVKIIQVFLEDGIVLVRKTVDAFNQGDASALEFATHTLKSSSAYLGALHLSHLCGQLEKLGGAGNLIGATPLIQQLETEYSKVELALQFKLKDLVET